MSTPNVMNQSTEYTEAQKTLRGPNFWIGFVSGVVFSMVVCGVAIMANLR